MPLNNAEEVIGGVTFRMGTLTVGNTDVCYDNISDYSMPDTSFNKKSIIWGFIIFSAGVAISSLFPFIALMTLAIGAITAYTGFPKEKPYRLNRVVIKLKNGTEQLMPVNTEEVNRKLILKLRQVKNNAPLSTYHLEIRQYHESQHIQDSHIQL